MADYLSIRFLPLADKARFNGRKVDSNSKYGTIFDSRKVTHGLVALPPLGGSGELVAHGGSADLRDRQPFAG